MPLYSSALNSVQGGHSLGWLDFCMNCSREAVNENVTKCALKLGQFILLAIIPDLVVGDQRIRGNFIVQLVKLQ